MGAAAAAVGAQGTGGAYGIYEAFQSKKIHKQNASIYEQNIPYIRARAAEQARQLQVGKYLTTGAQKAGYAGRGLAVGGSVFDVMEDTTTNFNRDTSFVLLEGELAARDEQRKADLARYQGKVGVRDAVVGGVLNTVAVGARTRMPIFSSASWGGGGFGTADPRETGEPLKNWWGGGGMGAAK